MLSFVRRSSQVEDRNYCVNVCVIFDFCMFVFSPVMEVENYCVVKQLS